MPADEPSDGGGSFQLGVRAVYLDPHKPTFQATQYIEGNMTGKVYPEIFVEWFLWRSWSTELSVGAPTTFSVSNTGGIGIRLTPFTWTAKYHFLPDSRVRPYIGAGLQYTKSTLADVPGSNYGGIDSSTRGYVAQGGVNVRTASHWYVDADIRYLNGLDPSGYKVDPFLYSFGVSYRW